MNLHETAMGQRFFNAQLPALINTLKDIAAALSRPAPSAISFPADPRFLTSLYYGEYEADVFKPDKRLTPFNQTVQQKEKALLPLLSSEASTAFEQYQAAVQCRNSAVLEQAYASGYRTAVQMFAAGLGPQPPVQIQMLAWGLILFVGLIGILNIINTVYTNIHTRVTEIGMQRAIGMSADSLYKTFLWEGAYYGIIASVIGSVLGYVCTIFIEAATSDTIQLVAIPVMPILEATLLAVGACLLATAIPLRKISKMSIVDSIETVE